MIFSTTTARVAAVCIVAYAVYFAYVYGRYLATAECLRTTGEQARVIDGTYRIIQPTPERPVAP